MLQKVETRVRILADLRELASAESLDSFTLIYTNILEHQPDCPVIFSTSYSILPEISGLVVHSFLLMCWTWYLRYVAWGCWEACGNEGRHSKEGSQRGKNITFFTSYAMCGSILCETVQIRPIPVVKLCLLKVIRKTVSQNFLIDNYVFTVHSSFLGCTRVQGNIRELSCRREPSKVWFCVWQIEVPNSTERHMEQAWTVNDAATFE